MYAKYIFNMFVDLLPVSPYHLAVPKYMKVVGLIRPTKSPTSIPAVLMSCLSGCDKKISQYSSSRTPATCSTQLRNIVAGVFSPSSSLCILHFLVWIIVWYYINLEVILLYDPGLINYKNTTMNPDLHFPGTSFR